MPQDAIATVDSRASKTALVIVCVIGKLPSAAQFGYEVITNCVSNLYGLLYNNNHEDFVSALKLLDCEEDLL